MASDVYAEIMREYGALRRKAESLRRDRLKAVYAALPEIKRIDAELSETGVDLSRAMLSLDNGAEKAGLLARARERNESLKARRAALLLESGYEPGFLEPVYECEICKDTGRAENKQCVCLMKRLIEKHTRKSGLSPLSANDTFIMFEPRYYSAEKDPKRGVSPQANMKLVFKQCLEFTESFDKEFINLMFRGDTGLGKTFLSNCIANSLLSAGKTVVYYSAPRLFKIVEDRRFGGYANKDGLDEIYDLLYTCDLMIIDDLGSEFATAVTDAELFNLINQRLLEKKPLIISTNLSHADFISHYSERISSRIFGGYVLLDFFGDDIRMKKKYNL